MTLDLTPAGSFELKTAVACPLQTNCYMLRSRDEVLIIDPAASGSEIYRYAMEGEGAARLAAVVSTHGHGDHVGGVEGVLDEAEKETGVRPPYLISEADAERAQNANANSSHDFGYDADAPAPDRMLREGDVIAFGDVRLQVLETPGHTPGGVVLFCATSDGMFAFVGDTLFPGSAGRTDLKGGDSRALIRSLGRLARELPPETVCLPGHGPSTTMAVELDSNPYIAQAERLGF